jgi:hypothetical protein
MDCLFYSLISANVYKYQYLTGWVYLRSVWAFLPTNSGKACLLIPTIGAKACLPIFSRQERLPNVSELAANQ